MCFSQLLVEFLNPTFQLFLAVMMEFCCLVLMHKAQGDACQDFIAIESEESQNILICDGCLMKLFQLYPEVRCKKGGKKDILKSFEVLM